MVLQQSPFSAKIWGKSVVGSSIDITLTLESNQQIIDKVNAITDSTGFWSIYFKPIAASNNAYTITATTSNDTISMSNILFGDVFVCGGQSNMQFTVDSAFNASNEVQAANNYPMIRLFTASEIGAAKPQIELLKIEEPWSVASNLTVGGGNWSYFSAMCWFFGRNLHEFRKYPIGLIGSNYGGTPIRYWSSPDAISKCNDSISNENDFLDYYNAQGQKLELADSQLWNAQIYPFLQTTIRAVIWYQGEADANQDATTNYAQKYECAFPAMISDWRRQWAQNSNTSIDFPFGYVHLSTWGDTTANKTCGNDVECQYAAIVRWGQSGNYGFVPNAAMPHTFMATAIDFGDPSSPFGDIHPRYKQEVAQRLTTAAKDVIYGQKGLYWQGPIADKAIVDGNNNLIISFKNIGSDGLVIKNSYGFEVYDESKSLWITTNGELSVNGQDSVSLPLSADVNGNSVTKVRYGWFQAPCFPTLGPQNCAIGSNEWPAIPFVVNVSNSLL